MAPQSQPDYYKQLSPEKIVQEVAIRSNMWCYLDDEFHVEAMNYIIIAWLWFATKVPQTPKSLPGSHKEN